jgi:hypothetical protein
VNSRNAATGECRYFLGFRWVNPVGVLQTCLIPYSKLSLALKRFRLRNRREHHVYCTFVWKRKAIQGIPQYVFIRGVADSSITTSDIGCLVDGLSSS